MKNTATEKTTEKRTAIYARQSVDKKDSISVETQIELCRTGAEKMLSASIRTAASAEKI